MGKTASSPSACTSTPTPTTPAVVPATQATYWAALWPNSQVRSKVPSPRAAIAQEESTTVWPCTARASRPPGSDGPNATPIARKREFISAEATTAAPTPPPAASTAMDANCAEPA